MKTINETQHRELSKLLILEYNKKTEKNPQYSLRALGRKLGVSSGALSEILNNKRRVTKATAIKILKNLYISENETTTFFNLIENKKIKREYTPLSLDQYSVLSQWEYLAFLNLIDLPKLSHDHNFISKKLNINANRLKEIIDRLLKLNMIERSRNRYKRLKIRYQTSEDIANEAIKKYHKVNLELAEESLRSDPVELRDFSSVVLKINIKNLCKVKKLIRQFQDDLCEFIENDSPEEIYHLNMQLYPVTKINKEIGV